MSFEIFVNGNTLDLWERATVKRDLEDNSGTFSFVTSSTVPPEEKYPILPGDLVNIKVDGKSMIYGFVDSIRGSQTDSRHLIDVDGRDNVQDLIDSSVPPTVKVTAGPISFENICKEFIDKLGADIPVISNVENLEDFTASDLKGVEFGGTCMAELVSFARKRQVYLIPDGEGRLLIYRPRESNLATGVLNHKLNDNANNVKSFSLKISDQQRFYKYSVSSQDNIGFSPLASWVKDHPEDAQADDGTNRNGTVIDEDIRETRYLEVEAEETMNKLECGERAAEEANLRRGFGQEYACVVAEHSMPDGTVWDIGQFVNIVDEFASIEGELLVKSVDFAMDKRRGSVTRLTCVAPDTFQVTADATRKINRRTRLASAFQDVEKSKNKAKIRRIQNIYGVKFP